MYRAHLSHQEWQTGLRPLLHQPSLAGQNLHPRQDKPRTLGLDHFHLLSHEGDIPHQEGKWRRAGPTTHRQCPLVEQDCHSERSGPPPWLQFHDTWNRHSFHERGRPLGQSSVMLSPRRLTLFARREVSSNLAELVKTIEQLTGGWQLDSHQKNTRQTRGLTERTREREN